VRFTRIRSEKHQNALSTLDGEVTAGEGATSQAIKRASFQFFPQNILPSFTSFSSPTLRDRKAIAFYLIQAGSVTTILPFVHRPCLECGFALSNWIVKNSSPTATGRYDCFNIPLTFHRPLLGAYLGPELQHLALLVKRQIQPIYAPSLHSSKQSLVNAIYCILIITRRAGVLIS
jgi:hypothetical protein